MSEFEDKYKGWHTTASYTKSGIRIVACLVVLLYGLHSMEEFQTNWPVYVLAFGMLIAEFIGVIEEWV